MAVNVHVIMLVLVVTVMSMTLTVTMTVIMLTMPLRILNLCLQAIFYEPPPDILDTRTIGVTALPWTP